MQTVKYLLNKENTTGMVVLVYIELVVFTEIFGAYWGSFWGASASAILFFIILNHFFVLKDKDLYRSLLPMALLPLIRLMSYSFPLRIFPQFLWHLILGFPVVVTLTLIFQTPYFNRRAINMDYYPIMYIIFFGLLGIPAGLVAQIIQLAQSQGTGSNIILNVIAAIILFAFAALPEEILFRGLLTESLSAVFNRGATVLVNILYASMFFGSQSIYMVLFMGLVGMVFSYFNNRSMSLWPSVAANWFFKVSFLLIGPILIDRFVIFTS